ncbi:unnamed protein product [Paramecium primaurelia]|uniref:Uncharacterized protein n=1 Tax=Paramecium primaurelia TaxID=5886 RepID=A0A8S1KBE1_PARPR|nr:unnamed protein product [Paramecium primaurelia]
MQDIKIYNYDIHQIRLNFHHHIVPQLQLINLHKQVNINYLYYHNQMDKQKQHNYYHAKWKYHHHKSYNKMQIMHLPQLDIIYKNLNYYHNILIDICNQIHPKFQIVLNDKLNKMNLIIQNTFHIQLNKANITIKIHQSNIHYYIHKYFHLILNQLKLCMLNNSYQQDHYICYKVYHMVNIVLYQVSHNNHQNINIIHLINIVKMQIHNVYNSYLINIICKYNCNLNNQCHQNINQVDNLKYKMQLLIHNQAYMLNNHIHLNTLDIHQDNIHMWKQYHLKINLINIMIIPLLLCLNHKPSKHHMSIHLNINCNMVYSNEQQYSSLIIHNRNQQHQHQNIILQLSKQDYRLRLILQFKLDQLNTKLCFQYHY